MPTVLPTSLEGLFDDAGLFPPARWPMAHALSRHHEILSGPHRRYVGPFLCPAGRLNELDACVASGVPRPERLGVVLDTDAGVARMLSRDGLVQVEGALSISLPENGGRVRRYLELPPGDGVSSSVAAVVRRQAGVKVRCGGATPDMIPPVGWLAEVLVVCAQRQVQLKATAGLHQPFRHEDEQLGTHQHGFLNLLAAASAAVEGADRTEVEEILSATAGNGTSEIIDRVDRRSRELVRSVGTCSLDEPLAALEELGVLT